MRIIYLVSISALLVLQGCSHSPRAPIVPLTNNRSPQPAEPAPAENVITETMESTVLGEQRRILIVLPASYKEDGQRRYPVVYVLDGGSQVRHTARAAATMARAGAMPEIITVGLPNSSGPNRDRDYTPPFLSRNTDNPESPVGAGDKFLDFLKIEIIPRIERDYRTDPFRILAGRSLGGLLVVYSLIANPQLFNARFAFSAPVWRADAITVSKLNEALVSSRTELDTFFYMAVGDEETENMVAGYRRAVTVLEQQAPKGLKWRAEITPRANHQNEAELATPDAFKALYGGWRPPKQTRMVFR